MSVLEMMVKSKVSEIIQAEYRTSPVARSELGILCLAAISKVFAKYDKEGQQEKKIETLYKINRKLVDKWDRDLDHFEKLLMNLEILSTFNGVRGAVLDTGLARKYDIGIPTEVAVRSQGRLHVGQYFDVDTWLKAVPLWNKEDALICEGLVLVKKK